MVRQLERRISKLEGTQNIGPPVDPPMLIICEPDESEEAAVLRVCGPKGLPSRPAGTGPHLIVVPIRGTLPGRHPWEG
jgi:hypothetical protein